MRSLRILVEMSDNNLRELVGILKKRGYHVKQPVDPMGIANVDLRNDWIHNKHMKAFNFYKEKELKEVDIIIDSPVSFEKAKKTAVHIRVGNIILPVISIANLINMKKGACRGIDALDIQQLRKITQLRRKK